MAAQKRSRHQPSKSRYHHGDLPAVLVEAAVALIGQYGTAKLSLREVARAAGVSHGAPAHHFGDKQGLFTAIAIEGYRRRNEKMLAARQAAGDSGKEALKAIGRTYVIFAADEPAFFEVMYQPALVDENEPRLQQAIGASRDLLSEVIAGLQQSDGDDSSRSDTNFVRAWGMVHGIAMLWLSGNLGDRSERRELDRLLDRVFDF